MSPLIYISFLQILSIIILILFYIHVYSKELKKSEIKFQPSPTKIKYIRRAYSKRSTPSSPSKKRSEKKSSFDYSPIPFSYNQPHNDILKTSKQYLNLIQTQLNNEMIKVSCASYKTESEYKIDLNYIESSINENWNQSNETLTALSFVRLITLSKAYCSQNQQLFEPDEFINTCRRILSKENFLNNVKSSTPDNALPSICLQLIRCLTFQFPHDFESKLIRDILPQLINSLNYNSSNEYWTSIEFTILSIIINVRIEINFLLSLYNSIFQNDDDNSINSKRFLAHTSFYLFLSSSLYRLTSEQLQIAYQIITSSSEDPSLTTSFQLSLLLISQVSPSSLSSL